LSYWHPSLTDADLKRIFNASISKEIKYYPIVLLFIVSALPAMAACSPQLLSPSQAREPTSAIPHSVEPAGATVPAIEVCCGTEWDEIMEIATPALESLVFAQ